MNPVLLKPNSETGSQVIVLGKPVGNMSVGEYIRFKPQVFGTIAKAYDDLASSRQVMVLEGAGSPARSTSSPRCGSMAWPVMPKPASIWRRHRPGGVFGAPSTDQVVMEEREGRWWGRFIVNSIRRRGTYRRCRRLRSCGFTGVETLGVVCRISRNLGLPG
jgi:hypothetical protein